MKYPYSKSNSGINLKFIPHNPTKKVGGINNTVNIVKNLIISFVLVETDEK
jgi:hypothetical protein